MRIACSEARETHYWLRLAGAARLLPAQRLKDLVEEADEIIRILGTIINRTNDRK